MYYEQLKAGVIQHDLLVDKLIYKVRSSTPTGTTAKIFIPFNINSDSEVFRDCSDMLPPSPKLLRTLSSSSLRRT